MCYGWLLAESLSKNGNLSSAKRQNLRYLRLCVFAVIQYKRALRECSINTYVRVLNLQEAAKAEMNVAAQSQLTEIKEQRDELRERTSTRNR
jgi:hypothetical protein